MKIIEIEGLDGSGKATQSALLAERLCAEGRPARRITFPDYDHPWSLFTKMYLGGEFGDVGDVSAYTAASFYALDRYASFKKVWEPVWRGGDILVADRYVGSNLIHQMSKLPRGEWDAFFRWQQDFEFDKCGLPRPDRVVYLEMDPDVSRRLMEKRYRGDESKKDIHERNHAYLLACRETAQYAAERCGWATIHCCEGGSLLPVEAIQEKIRAAAADIL